MHSKIDKTYLPVCAEAKVTLGSNKTPKPFSVSFRRPISKVNGDNNQKSFSCHFVQSVTNSQCRTYPSAKLYIREYGMHSPGLTEHSTK